jgi:hypothetical protein
LQELGIEFVFVIRVFGAGQKFKVQGGYYGHYQSDYTKAAKKRLQRRMVL